MFAIVKTLTGSKTHAIKTGEFSGWEQYSAPAFCGVSNKGETWRGYWYVSRTVDVQEVRDLDASKVTCTRCAAHIARAAAEAAKQSAETPAEVTHTRESAFSAAAALFIADSAPCKVNGAIAAHFVEGAEYNTGGPNAYTNDSGKAYVSLLCKRCGLEAEYPAAGQTVTVARCEYVGDCETAHADVTEYTLSSTGKTVDAVTVRVFGGNRHYVRVEAAHLALEALTAALTVPVCVEQYQTAAQQDGSVLFLYSVEF